MAGRIEKIDGALLRGALPINLGLVDDGLYRLFGALVTPVGSRAEADTVLQAARDALDRIRQSDRREIYVKCLVLCARWCIRVDLYPGAARILLEEARDEARACEMPCMRIDAEVALIAVSLKEGVPPNTLRPILNVLQRQAKELGYEVRARELADLKLAMAEKQRKPADRRTG